MKHLIHFDLYRLKRSKSFFILIAALILFIICISIKADSEISVKQGILSFQTNGVMIGSLALFYVFTMFYFFKSNIPQEEIWCGFRRTSVYLSKMIVFTLECFILSFLFAVAMIAGSFSKGYGDIIDASEIGFLIRCFFGLFFLVSIFASIAFAVAMNSEMAICLVLYILIAAANTIVLEIIQIDQLSIFLQYSFVYIITLIFAEKLSLLQTIGMFSSLIFQEVLVVFLGLMLFRKKELR